MVIGDTVLDSLFNYSEPLTVYLQRKKKKRGIYIAESVLFRMMIKPGIFKISFDVAYNVS